MKSKRKKPRPNRMTAEELDCLRAERWLMDAGLCWRCTRPTIFNAPIEWDNSFHLEHVQNKRMYGDSIENTRTCCGECHRLYHLWGPSMTKPCPRKTA